MSSDGLRSADEAWNLVVGDRVSAGIAINELDSSASLTRLLRGSRMATVDDLFAEFAAAFQFPWYFGHNWPAFGECLGDLDWLGAATDVTVVVMDAHELLHRAGRERPGFIRALQFVAAEWRSPTELGDSRRPPGGRFALVCQVPSDGEESFRSAWRGTAIEISDVVFG